MPTVLTIAGSDPSGGAGIQADLKTFAAIGVYGGAVVSSITVQNTRGVERVEPLAPDLVREQIEAVLSDLAVSHVKIGMVGSAAVAEAIGRALRDFAGEVIYDPVLRASSGKSLFNANAMAALEEHLLGRATVLTPNLPEFGQLVGRLAPEAGAAALFQRFPRLRAVAITGGHDQAQPETVTDRLLCRPRPGEEMTALDRSHPRVATPNSHGTGCTFASAFAAYHQQCDDYRLAFTRAVDFVDHLLQASRDHWIGHGTGPLLHHLWQRKTD